MAMPPQLARAKRPKRTTPRPLVETLPRIDIRDLCRWNVFPSQYDWHKAHILELPFRYPFIRSLVISLENIEINHHNGYTQPIKLRWIRTGFGGVSRPRPIFICTNCGRSITKLYFKGGSLNCRRCANAVYSSQVCDKYSRPILRSQRMQALLKLKSYMSKRNRQRIRARITAAPSQELKSKRLSHHSIQLPQSNYSTRGAMHWR
jgi:hypothetical protein